MARRRRASRTCIKDGNQVLRAIPMEKTAFKKSLAIITARGGSKRIPRKNIKDFCGKPILSYSIEAALESDIFDEVMVSTDDQEIAEISKTLGAEVPFLRSEKTSDDFSTTSDVLVEVIESYEAKKMHFDSFCCIYPTAPFVTPKILKKAKSILESDRTVDSVVPILQFSFPPQRAFAEEGNYVRFIFPEYSQLRSQDLKPIFHDCGQFYYCKTERFKKYKNIIMPKTVGIKRDELHCQDIDNYSDWRLAELKYSLLKEEGLLND